MGPDWPLSFRDVITLPDCHREVFPFPQLLQLSESQAKRLDDYDLLDPKADVYDLNQNPQLRRRSSTGTLATLTTNCSAWWIKCKRRFFCGLVQFVSVTKPLVDSCIHA